LLRRGGIAIGGVRRWLGADQGLLALTGFPQFQSARLWIQPKHHSPAVERVCDANQSDL
jgi:hypothetical protein